MAQPIYRLFLGRMSEAWHQLSQEEQAELIAKNDEALDRVGGRRVLECDSRWCSEQWPFFGVEEFPDIQAVQEYTAALSEYNWFRYAEAVTVLGTEYQE